MGEILHPDEKSSWPQRCYANASPREGAPSGIAQIGWDPCTGQIVSEQLCCSGASALVTAQPYCAGWRRPSLDILYGSPWFITYRPAYLVAHARDRQFVWLREVLGKTFPPCRL
jgi:hypothetical protein